MESSSIFNSLIALASGSFAAAVAAFLPEPSTWDATDAAAFAFVCAVAGRLGGIAANWVAGPIRDPDTGELTKRYDDRRWGENLAFVGGGVALLIAAL